MSCDFEASVGRGLKHPLAGCRTESGPPCRYGKESGLCAGIRQPGEQQQPGGLWCKLLQNQDWRRGCSFPSESSVSQSPMFFGTILS